MWRLFLAFVGIFAISASESHSDAQYVTGDVLGTWTLESDPDGAYLLAASGTPGSFLICFTSGNTRRIVVSVGDEHSNLARGSCTVFSPTTTSGIVVELPANDAEAQAQRIALGTFRMILPPAE